MLVKCAYMSLDYLGRLEWKILSSPHIMLVGWFVGCLVGERRRGENYTARSALVRLIARMFARLSIKQILGDLLLAWQARGPQVWSNIAYKSLCGDYAVIYMSHDLLCHPGIPMTHLMRLNKHQLLCVHNILCYKLSVPFLHIHQISSYSLPHPGIHWHEIWLGVRGS